MPDFEIESSINKTVAGIDEAGRGPWAGPVVAGAVIIKDRHLDAFLLEGLDDSKKLSAKSVRPYMKSCLRRSPAVRLLSALVRQVPKKLMRLTSYRRLFWQCGELSKH